MHKLMVTGCAGFIGSHLCEKLLSMNYQVVGVDNFDPFYAKEIKTSNLHHFQSHPNFAFYEFDLADESSYPDDAFHEIEMVVHLAGKAGVRPSIEDPSAYMKANVVATQNLLSAMTRHAIKKLAFASSSSVYGNTKTTPFNEEMDVSSPISPYAATKKACELLNHTFHHLHRMDIVNMRFFTVFGPRQRPDLAIHKFTRLIRAGEAISMFGDGTSARDYTYIEDTVSGIVGTIDYLFKNENVFEIINLGNNHPVPLKKMIDTIYKAAGEAKKIKQHPMQPGDVDITFASISKAKQLLNYNPHFDFEEGIVRFVNWYDSLHQ